MNHYRYSDIKVGDIEGFSVIIQEEFLELFLKITGDDNPLHMDGHYARDKGFNDRVVYGMLTSAFFSKLVGTLLPGEYCLFQEADVQFRKPVYVGDQLEIKGECIEKSDTFKRLTIKATIRNQNNDLVCSGRLKVGMLDD